MANEKADMIGKETIVEFQNRYHKIRCEVIKVTGFK